MDYESVEMTHDHEDIRKMDASSEDVKSEMNLLNERPQDPPKEVMQPNKVQTTESEDVTMRVAPADIDVSGDVNMEASISTDDVMRAGGFGARDDISCFLPVASDSTDFEASLRDARDYEEPQGEICRPGLGWKT